MTKHVKGDKAELGKFQRRRERPFGTKIMLTPLPYGFTVHRASPSFT